MAGQANAFLKIRLDARRSTCRDRVTAVGYVRRGNVCTLIVNGAQVWTHLSGHVLVPIKVSISWILPQVAAIGNLDGGKEH